MNSGNIEVGTNNKLIIPKLMFYPLKSIVRLLVYKLELIIVQGESFINVVKSHFSVFHKIPMCIFSNCSIFKYLYQRRFCSCRYFRMDYFKTVSILAVSDLRPSDSLTNLREMDKNERYLTFLVPRV